MWRERGLTMVLVTHDTSIARRAQRIGVMKNGRLGFKQPRPGQAARVQTARPSLGAAGSPGAAGRLGAEAVPSPAPGRNPAGVPSLAVQASPAWVTDRSELQPPDLPDLEDSGLADPDVEDSDLSGLEDDDSEPADTITFD
jgi:energy-coupling factor transporter ATP-binding protein EcfA2